MGTNDWIALGSMLTAFSALAFSLWSSAIQRRREEILLDPNLTPYRRTYKQDGGIGTLEVGVENTGLGPAKIVSFKPLLNDETQELGTLLDVCTGSSPHRRDIVTSLGIGSSIRANREICLVKVSCKASSQDQLDKFASLFENARIEIEYKSHLKDCIKAVIVGE